MVETRRNKIKDALIRRSSFIILLILILGAVGLLRIVITHRQVDDVANIDLPLIEILTEVETNQLEQTINFERALRYGKEIEDSGVLTKGFAKADSAFKFLVHEVDLSLVEAENKVKEALSKTSQESQKIKLRGLLLSVKKLQKDHKNYETEAYKVIEMIAKGQYSDSSQFIEKVEENENSFNIQVEGVLMRHEMLTEAVAQVIEQKEVMSMKWVVAFTLVFIILSLIAVYAFSYRIWKPLDDIRVGSERLGKGYLDTRIQLTSSSITGDIVHSFNNMAHYMEQSQTEINKFINFSYSAANDLKMPVNNLISLLDMLGNDKIGGASFVSVLNNAKKITNQLSNTISDLSEVNKIRENLRIEDKNTLFLNDVLKETLSEIKENFPKIKISIKKDFSEAPSVIYGKSSLKSILKILIANSVMYKDPKKDLVIKIYSQEINNRITLIYKDNGLGFDYIKHQHSIFNPFVRLHKYTEGSGLGLYIVKMILDFNKDYIKVFSEIGKGTTFKVFLRDSY